MLEDSETPRYAAPRTHRTYSPTFKAQLVAACQLPGVSIAALASAHQINAGLLRRWLKEHARNGCHQITPADSSPPPRFIPAQLPTPTVEPTPSPVIRVELRKGSLSMEMVWPMAAAADCATWMREVLR